MSNLKLLIKCLNHPKAMHQSWKVIIKEPNFWFAFLVALVMVLHIQVPYFLTTNLNVAIIRAIAFAGVISILRQKRNELPPNQSSPVACGIGIICLVFVLLRSWLIRGNPDVMFDVLPIFSAIGLTLIYSGFKNLGFYRRELFMVALSSIPTAHVSGLLDGLLNFTKLAAIFADTGLKYLGFEVVRQGVIIALPNGAIEVYSGCSGLPSIIVLLQLGALFVTYTPLTPTMMIIMPIFSATIAFLVNGVRIILMALLINANNMSGFEYWHGGDGEQIFSLASILIFGLICERIWDISSQHEDMENS